ncbi:MAG: squalene/phytoene synthase family protein [Aestuariivita sp.]|uniref:phytoene/squalene synthase family protein n=1 Tax=Aestuariivita sp. TaxID=1872407 RepID=UPI003BAEFAF5
MSVQACAALVERGDPDRFLAVMAAPVAARRVLFPLYAFNLEVARAPWVTQESMIAEMRLQWWRDAVEEIAKGSSVRRHEVTTPLAEVISRDIALKLDPLVAARRWDIYKDPFEDQSHFDTYIDQTSATLLWAAASSLGEVEEQTVRDLGYAQGVANWLRAIPELEARKRIPLLDGTSDGIRALSDRALARLHRARSKRHTISKPARAALLAAWQAETILKLARNTPGAVAQGALEQSPARKRLSLILRSATGRW